MVYYKLVWENRVEFCMWIHFLYFEKEQKNPIQSNILTALPETTIKDSESLEFDFNLPNVIISHRFMFVYILDWKIIWCKIYK